MEVGVLESTPASRYAPIRDLMRHKAAAAAIIQTAWRRFHVFRSLILGPRRAFLKICEQLEGSFYTLESGDMDVSWPLRNVLCRPVVQSRKRETVLKLEATKQALYKAQSMNQAIRNASEELRDISTERIREAREAESRAQCLLQLSQSKLREAHKYNHKITEEIVMFRKGAADEIASVKEKLRVMENRYREASLESEKMRIAIQETEEMQRAERQRVVHLAEETERDRRTSLLQNLNDHITPDNRARIADERRAYTKKLEEAERARRLILHKNASDEGHEERLRRVALATQLAEQSRNEKLRVFRLSDNGEESGEAARVLEEQERQRRINFHTRAMKSSREQRKESINLAIDLAEMARKEQMPPDFVPPPPVMPPARRSSPVVELEQEMPIHVIATDAAASCGARHSPVPPFSQHQPKSTYPKATDLTEHKSPEDLRRKLNLLRTAVTARVRFLGLEV